MECYPGLRAGAVVMLMCAGAWFASGGRCQADQEKGLLHVTFRREVVNLEDFAGRLVPVRPAELRGGPSAQGEIWFGTILRQLPDVDPASQDHNVFFAVQFQGLMPVRAWCDTDLNGDLSDDAVVPLSTFPQAKPARSFLSNLRWSVRRSGGERQIERLVRVVLEAPDSATARRTYRTQDVFGMLGKVDVEGSPRLVLLFDANRDGIYTRGGSDGIFFDVDGDRHFSIDVMAPEFAPLALPVRIGNTVYDVVAVGEQGTEVDLRAAGPASPYPSPPVLGQPAPAFPYTDTSGRRWSLSDLRGRQVVVYFWGSWCGVCNRHADALRDLYERRKDSGLEILSVSYDTDRGEMDRFRREHKQTWPASFTGGFPAEDPVGRAFREAGSGIFYVIAPDGRLAAKVFGVEDLELQLGKLVTGQVRSER